VDQVGWTEFSKALQELSWALPLLRLKLYSSPHPKTDFATLKMKI